MANHKYAGVGAGTVACSTHGGRKLNCKLKRPKYTSQGVSFAPFAALKATNRASLTVAFFGKGGLTHTSLLARLYYLRTQSIKDWVTVFGVIIHDLVLSQGPTAVLRRSGGWSDGLFSGPGYF